MDSRQPCPASVLGSTGHLGRRAFLGRAASVALGGAAAQGCAFEQAEPVGEAREGNADQNPDQDLTSWDGVRAQFPESDLVQMSALFIASHPRLIGDAIEAYRAELDRDPVGTLETHNAARRDEVRQAAARYLGADAGEIALTDSTTMGLGLVYGGLPLREGDEILTTEQDYYVTHEALRLVASRTGARVRRLPLYEEIGDVSAADLASRIVREIGDATRVLALTWVHSSTGLRLPVEAIGQAVRSINEHRPEQRRVLFCVDAVHGFGIEPVTVNDIGCDFFVSGCHKWLFGPRGTGLVWGKPASWARLHAVIPTFADDDVWAAWMRGEEPKGPTTAARMTPGGFKAFEHQWAMTMAFAFHERVGPERVRARTHELNRALKEGLRAMPHVRLVTPMPDDLSAGIVCFDVENVSPWDAVAHLRRHRVVGTVTPYAVRHVRLTPSIRNSHGEVDRVLSAIHALT
jgi:isopenicillin-N epimerase